MTSYQITAIRPDGSMVGVVGGTLGWPCVAQSWGRLFINSRTIRQYGTTRSMIVPTHVVWPGFAINTAVYGAISFALLPIPRLAIRRRRRVRGRCATCAYDLRGNRGPACPECGS